MAKNENQPGQAAKVWRYAHFHSHIAFNQKRAVLKACLQKIHKMASDNRVLYTSAVQKLQEFGRLQYPYKLLWRMCTTMGTQTSAGAGGNKIITWVTIWLPGQQNCYLGNKVVTRHPR